LSSCNSGPSLQKYFVEKTEDKNFIALDVAPSILNIDKSKLSAEEFEAIETFKTINILAFQVNGGNKAMYQAEKTKVEEILKDNKYEELMHVGSGQDGASVSFVGTEESVDEFILYANRKESGFAVVRIVGDDMTPNSVMAMMSVLRNSNINMEQLKPLQEMFSNNIQ
jgi:hypothetical protein